MLFRISSSCLPLKSGSIFNIAKELLCLTGQGCIFPAIPIILSSAVITAKFVSSSLSIFGGGLN
jgi:hypothetical protein